ncbi:hypothetical protein WJX72_001357 [[Myrmecia] bisecta]|uniref:EF-hand domain-containing protein n=1 Tax=[Myrmecia] bisecta TaxID=41462 RepID=A0AAW1QPB6_9CHLO
MAAVAAHGHGANIDTRAARSMTDQADVPTKQLPAALFSESSGYSSQARELLQAYAASAGGQARQPSKPGPAALDERPMILVTTVDIGDGKTDKIQLRQGDSVEEAARAFCLKNGLQESIITPLARHIQDNLDQAMLERAQAGGTDLGAGTDSQSVGRSATSRPSDFASAAEYQSAANSPRQPYLYEPADQKRRPRSAGPPLRRGGSGPSVFDRLYDNAREIQSKQDEKRRIRDNEIEMTMQASRHSMTWVSQELMKGRGSGDYVNYGERLYVEGLLEREKKRAVAQARRAEAEEAELLGVTWRPQISKLAQSIKRGDSDPPPWLRLTQAKTNKTQERLEMIKRDREADDLKECTFRPAINSRSDRLMADRSEVLKEHKITAHEQLFQDAIRRRLRQEEYARWYPEDVTFHPAILGTVDRDKITSDVAVRSDAHIAERLYERRRKVDNKLAEARKQAEHPLDPVTGQPFYQPKIGRPPSYQRNHAELPIGEYLYGMRHEAEDKNEYISEMSRQQQHQEANMGYTTNHSQQLIARLKTKRFQQIFEYLDQDRDGALDLVALVAEDLELLETLDPEVRADVEMAARILARGHKLANSSSHPGSVPATPRTDGGLSTDQPLPASEGVLVDLEGFKGLMEEALKRGRGVPRSYLLPSPHPRSNEDHYTFAPEISARSKELAARRRPASQPVYEILHREASIIHERLQHRKEEIEQAQLKECTFRPAFVSEQLVEEGRAMKMTHQLTHHLPPTFYESSSRESTATRDSQVYEDLEREVRQALAATALAGAAHAKDAQHTYANAGAAHAPANTATTQAAPGVAEPKGKRASRDGAQAMQADPLQDLEAQLQSMGQGPPEIRRWGSNEDGELVAEMFPADATNLAALQGLAASN